MPAFNLFVCLLAMFLQCSSQSIVQFKEANITVAFDENADTKQHCVDLEVTNRNVSLGAISVSLQVDNTTATAIMNKDFTLDNTTVTFPTNQNSALVCVTYLDDDERESDEMFVVEVVTQASPAVTIGPNKKVYFKIIDAGDRESDDQTVQNEDTETNSRFNELLILISVGVAFLSVLLIAILIMMCCLFRTKTKK